MNFKIVRFSVPKSLLLLTCAFVVSQAFACEVASLDDAEVKSSRKCLKANSLAICNNGIFGGNLTVNGSETIIGAVSTGALTVNGNLVVTGTVFVDGSEVIDGNLTVGGSETIGGSLTVTTSICASSITLCPASAAGTPGVPGLGGALAYGEVGLDAGSGLSISVATDGGFVAFNYAGPLANETANYDATPHTATDDGLVLSSAGTYAFEYLVDETLAVLGEVALSINGTTVPHSTFSNGVVGAGQIDGFIIADVTPAQILAGGLVQLVNPSTTVTLTLSTTGIGAKLTATRIA